MLEKTEEDKRERERENEESKLCSSDRKEGGRDSGLGRKRKGGIAKKRRSLSILHEFHFYFLFSTDRKRCFVGKIAVRSQLLSELG